MKKYIITLLLVSFGANADDGHDHAEGATQAAVTNQSSSSRSAVNVPFLPATVATANCALSTSAGFALIGVAASIGRAYVDENCAKLEKIRSVADVLGDVETAEAMMCTDLLYSTARATVGRPCK